MLIPVIACPEVFRELVLSNVSKLTFLVTLGRSKTITTKPHALDKMPGLNTNINPIRTVLS